MGKGLSKSKILSGLQCPKRLYLETYQPDLRDDSGSAFAFAIGNALGDLARTLDSGGVLIEHDDDLKAALAETQQYLDSGDDQILYEATFAHDGVLVRADILYLEDGVLTFSEVKSTGRVKSYHIPDCAVQAWVMEQAGYPLNSIYLAHVDTSFVYLGDGSYQGILHHEDITEQVRELIPEVGQWVSEFREVLDGPEPEVEVGDHCSSPYDCPFQAHCWPEPPEYPVTSLPRKGKIVVELLGEGIEDIRDIPEGRLTNKNHQRVRRITISGQEELDPEAKRVLDQLDYPRYYLDFETVGMVIPRWKGTRPYQALPFQWSCHVEQADGQLEHREFLDVSGEVPIRKLAESLISDLGQSGPIFMYTSFERTVIKDLVKQFPDLAAGLEALIARLVDLHPIARDYYYHPDMKGSWSIKYVLPAIAPDLSYQEIGEVQDGLAAGRAYQEILDELTPIERKVKLEKDLLEYCQLDTLAMVRLAHKLEGRSVRA